jgi:hypothetical protein
LARLGDGPPAPRVQPRPVDSIRKTVIRPPVRAEDDLAPVA